jgi:hypothetical protein
VAWAEPRAAPVQPEPVDKYGFTVDGYDYSQHFREPGGGTFVPAIEHGAKPVPAPVAEVVMRDERQQAEAEVRASHPRHARRRPKPPAAQTHDGGRDHGGL